MVKLGQPEAPRHCYTRWMDERECPDGYQILLGKRTPNEKLHNLYEVRVGDAQDRSDMEAAILNPMPFLRQKPEIGDIILARDNDRANRIARFGVVRKKKPEVELSHEGLKEVQKFILDFTRGKQTKTYHKEWLWWRGHRKTWLSRPPRFGWFLKYTDVAPSAHRQGVSLVACDLMSSVIANFRDSLRRDGERPSDGAFDLASRVVDTVYSWTLGAVSMRAVEEIEREIQDLHVSIDSSLCTPQSRLLPYRERDMLELACHCAGVATGNWNSVGYLYDATRLRCQITASDDNRMMGVLRQDEILLGMVCAE